MKRSNDLNFWINNPTIVVYGFLEYVENRQLNHDSLNRVKDGLLLSVTIRPLDSNENAGLFACTTLIRKLKPKPITLRPTCLVGLGDGFRDGKSGVGERTRNGVLQRRSRRIRLAVGYHMNYGLIIGKLRKLGWLIRHVVLNW